MTDAEIEKVNGWIEKGIRKIIPAHLLTAVYLGDDPVTGVARFSETQILQDVRQMVWVKLLESGNLSGRCAFNLGRAESSKWLRNDKLLPVSQMNLREVGDSGADMETLLPWDAVDLSKPQQYDEEIYRLLSQVEDSERLRLFKDLPRRDRLFLRRYVASASVKTEVQRKRFQRLTERLKKRLEN